MIMEVDTTDAASITKCPDHLEIREHEHIISLLKFLQQHSDQETSMAKLVSECGQSCSVPLPLLCLAWPGLSVMIQGSMCCSDFKIFVPSSRQTVLYLIDMLYTGICSPDNSSEMSSVRDLCSVLGLNWNLEDSSQEKQIIEHEDQTISDTSDTFILTEEFSDEEVDMTDNTLHSNREDQVLQGQGPSMLCSRNCTNHCVRVTSSWSEDGHVHVKMRLKSERPMQSRINLISQLQAQENVGVDTENYFINGHEFCITFLAFFTGISDYLLRSLLGDYSSGIRMY